MALEMRHMQKVKWTVWFPSDNNWVGSPLKTHFKEFQVPLPLMMQAERPLN